MDSLLDKICNKLTSNINQDAKLMLVKWIEVLHSITNVDILKCVPKFLEQFLAMLKGQSKNEVSKKANEELEQFINEFEESQSRTVELDRDIMDKIIKFLLDKRDL